METPDTTWTEPALPPRLGARDVQVWRFPVDLPSVTLDRCRERLTASERDRADRFVQEADRRRFTVARCGLRLLLARHLERNPHELTFTDGPHGKPGLADTDPDDTREFNVSHAGGFALIAVARKRPVGVDLEPADRDIEPDDLAPRVLSAAETADLAGHVGARRLRRFLEIWTVKEAVVKALGRGISFPLSSFTVGIAPSGDVNLSGPDACGDLAGIEVVSLAPSDGYVGAVAIRGSDFRLQRFSGACLLEHAPRE
ncbi:hypothetical protein COW53_08075 [bacterium CG17_big_fil_post_rev_8_21_14_2_50_64_8]|nr:MAG: hypothetical protein COW53_08075 [bacterium CG17_big_fil_post_rev_8_21_14_2_50_64_8]PJA73640.1 MAG: hypothetical protein CO151_12770 [bacterium CG_4_9_14_3_um_filter_65_15]